MERTISGLLLWYAWRESSCNAAAPEILTSARRWNLLVNCIRDFQALWIALCFCAHKGGGRKVFSTFNLCLAAKILTNVRSPWKWAVVDWRSEEAKYGCWWPEMRLYFKLIEFAIWLNWRQTKTAWQRLQIVHSLYCREQIGSRWNPDSLAAIALSWARRGWWSNQGGRRQVLTLSEVLSPRFKYWLLLGAVLLSAPHSSPHPSTCFPRATLMKHWYPGSRLKTIHSRHAIVSDNSDFA